MGWVTKKGKRWEFNHLKWTFVSILMFIPFPIHIHPLVMMSRASKSKVRSWYVAAWFFLVIELLFFASFVYILMQISVGTSGFLQTLAFLTFGGSAVSYIVGNGLLLNQSKNYLQRLELGEMRPLTWIGSIEKQRKFELALAEMETPQTFTSKLLHYRKEIQNRNIQQSIDTILRLFHLLEQRDIQEAERFLVRHGTIVNVLREYDELENTRLHNQVAIESKAKLEKVLGQAASAVEIDVTNLIKSRLLDVSAESDVYIQTLRNKNLLKD